MMMAASFMLVVPASAQYTIFYWNPTSGVDFNTAANWSGGDPTLPGGKVFWIEGSTPVAITATPPYPADPIYTIPLFGGILNQTGGDVVVTPYQLICKNSAYNMTGGTYWAQGMQEYFSVGRFEGSGTLNVSGGYFKIDPSTVAGGDGIAMTVANPNQATGTVSGSVTVSGTGTIDCQTGFVSVCANGVVNIGDQSTSGVAGGVLKTLEVIGGQYYHGGGGGVLNFDGGTLVCTANVLGGYQFVELAEVNLLANGGTIEVPNGVTVRSDAVRGVAPISGIGGLAKTGDGVLVLAGTYNSYAGATTVQQGTLSLEGVQLASSSILVKPQ
jgi:fibronectin-binding autotransporter adhesin